MKKIVFGIITLLFLSMASPASAEPTVGNTGYAQLFCMPEAAKELVERVIAGEPGDGVATIYVNAGMCVYSPQPVEIENYGHEFVGVDDGVAYYIVFIDPDKTIAVIYAEPAEEV